MVIVKYRLYNIILNVKKVYIFEYLTYFSAEIFSAILRIRLRLTQSFKILQRQLGLYCIVGIFCTK